MLPDNAVKVSDWECVLVISLETERTLFPPKMDEGKNTPEYLMCHQHVLWKCPTLISEEDADYQRYHVVCVTPFTKEKETR